MNKKLIKWLIIILVVVIGVLIGLNKAGVLGGDEGISVTAEKVSNRDVTEVVTASGKVFQTQRHHRVHLGTDARARRWRKTHNAQTDHGT